MNYEERYVVYGFFFFVLVFNIFILSVFFLGVDVCIYKFCFVGYRCEVVDEKNVNCKGWYYSRVILRIVS